MKKGDIVYLQNEFINVIFLKDLENGLFLGARPNFHCAYIYSMEQIRDEYYSNYEEQDIQYCLESFTCTELSKSEFLQEVSNKKSFIKDSILEVMEKDNTSELFTFDDVCNAITIMMNTDENVGLLQSYLSLSKLQKVQIKEDATRIFRINNKVEKTVSYIVVDENNIDNIFYTEDYKLN